MKRSILLVASATIVVGIVIAAIKAKEFRQGKIRTTQATLATGDILIHEEDWWGREPFLNDSSPHRRLYIQWAGTNRRELITDRGWTRITPTPQCRIWKDGSSVVVQTPSALYWKDRAVNSLWARWSFTSPEREPLYSFLRDKVLHHPDSEFKEIEVEQGKRLALTRKHSHTFIGGSGSTVWSLPYQISEIDFSHNTLTATLQNRVTGLPNALVFSGSFDRFGEWEFDLALTNAHKRNEP